MNIEVFHLNTGNALNKNNSDLISSDTGLTNCVSRMDLADDKIFPVLTRKIQSLTCIFVFVKWSAKCQIYYVYTMYPKHHIKCLLCQRQILPEYTHL